MTHGNRLSLFSQYWYFMKFITLPIYRLPTLLTATKEGFKALWTWCFSPSFICPSGAAPVTQPGTTQFLTEDQSTEPFHVCLFIPFLIVLPTLSLHIKMVRTVRRIPVIERTKLHMSILVLKYATTLINLLSKRTRVKVGSRPAHTYAARCDASRCRLFL